MQNTVLLCDKNAKIFKISCLVKYPVFPEAWMHTLFSPGKNILHELLLKQKIFLSFNSPPSPISPPSLENLINTVVFAKKYWSVTQTAGWVCMSLLSVLVLSQILPCPCLTASCFTSLP